MFTEIADSRILEQFRETATKEQAFTQLMEKYRERIYRHIRRMVLDHDDAHDVTQNVFIKVWHGLDGFREDSKLFTWLYRIATNESITFINSKKRRAAVSIDNNENPVTRKLKSDPYFDGDETQLLILSAIESLPVKQKAVFEMRYYEEMPYEEMSRVMKTSEGALKASFHHAVKKIEEFVKSRLNQ